MKGIEHPEPSVIERLNSVLENPRYLILTEDNQEIINDNKIFKKIYRTNKKSIPYKRSFSLYFTSREIFHCQLSEAFLSRCTIINCPNYNNKQYLTIELLPNNNYETICKNFVNDQNLVNLIISLNKEINKFNKFDILRFIRWCKSAKNIFDKISTINQNSILKNNRNYIIGISALRSIIDRFDSNKRGIIVTKCLREYLPKKLYNLLALDFKEKLEENPFEIIENNVNNNYYIVSKYSGITLDIEERPNINDLDNIKWTKSSVDIADAILVALVSKTILILEGPPGRGKTAISKAVFDCLSIKDENLKRINFSPSTTIEDVFSRIIPKIQGNEISTIRKEQGLLSILNLSKNSKNIINMI